MKKKNEFAGILDEIDKLDTQQIAEQAGQEAVVTLGFNIIKSIIIAGLVVVLLVVLLAYVYLRTQVYTVSNAYTRFEQDLRYNRQYLAKQMSSAEVTWTAEDIQDYQRLLRTLDINLDEAVADMQAKGKQAYTDANGNRWLGYEKKKILGGLLTDYQFTFYPIKINLSAPDEALKLAYIKDGHIESYDLALGQTLSLGSQAPTSAVKLLIYNFVTDSNEPYRVSFSPQADQLRNNQWTLSLKPKTVALDVKLANEIIQAAQPLGLSQIRLKIGKNYEFEGASWQENLRFLEGETLEISGSLSYEGQEMTAKTETVYEIGAETSQLAVDLYLPSNLNYYLTSEYEEKND